MVAAIVSWSDCDAWLASLVGRLDAQRALLGTLLPQQMPKARMRPLEATYLVWLDLRPERTTLAVERLAAALT